VNSNRSTLKRGSPYRADMIAVSPTLSSELGRLRMFFPLTEQFRLCAGENTGTNVVVLSVLTSNYWASWISMCGFDFNDSPTGDQTVPSPCQCVGRQYHGGCVFRASPRTAPSLARVLELPGQFSDHLYWNAVRVPIRKARSSFDCAYPRSQSPRRTELGVELSSNRTNTGIASTSVLSKFRWQPVWLAPLRTSTS